MDLLSPFHRDAPGGSPREFLLGILYLAYTFVAMGAVKSLKQRVHRGIPPVPSGPRADPIDPLWDRDLDSESALRVHHRALEEAAR